MAWLTAFRGRSAGADPAGSPPSGQAAGTGSVGGRGRPLWGYVAALLVIGLLGICSYAAATTAAARADVATADREREAVRVMVALEAAQDALSAEITPSVLGHLLASARTLPWLAVDSPRDVRSLARVLALTLTSARGATDEALSAAVQMSAEPQLATVISDLAAARRRTDLTGPGAADIATVGRAFLYVADRLDRVQREAVNAALADSGSRGAASAIQDVTSVATANRAAGRQLPILVLSRPAPELAADLAASTLSWSQAAAGLDTLWSSALRARWRSIADTTALTGRDTDAMLHVPGSAAVLDLNRGLALTTSRSTVLLQLLYSALGTADEYAHSAGAAAQQRLREALTVAAALGVLSSAAAIWTGLMIARPLRGLAGDARRIRDGMLVDVAVSGPREVRMVSVALGSTVEGLRRLQAQASCVALGDLSNPLLSQPVDGPLGRVVHASIEMIVAAVRDSELLHAEMTHRAAHDELTGLLNRAGAVERITAALAGAGAEPGRTALLFIDLDGFKAVNDSRDTLPVTPCCARSRPGSPAWCDRTTWWPGSVATSSSSWCVRWAARRTSSSWPDVSSWWRRSRSSCRRRPGRSRCGWAPASGSPSPRTA